MSNIHNLSEIARTLMESDAKFDQDICKMTILFPLLETLGYDATVAGDIILNPAYANDGDYKMDYGLRGITDESIKTMIKMNGLFFIYSAPLVFSFVFGYLFPFLSTQSAPCGERQRWCRQRPRELLRQCPTPNRRL